MSFSYSIRTQLVSQLQQDAAMLENLWLQTNWKFLDAVEAGIIDPRDPDIYTLFARYRTFALLSAHGPVPMRRGVLHPILAENRFVEGGRQVQDEIPTEEEHDDEHGDHELMEQESPDLTHPVEWPVEQTEQADSTIAKAGLEVGQLQEKSERVTDPRPDPVIEEKAGGNKGKGKGKGKWQTLALKHDDVYQKGRISG